MKRALVTGITGQDGSYMAELLLSKGYQVFGTIEEGIDESNISHIRDQLDIYVADLLKPEMFDEVLEASRPHEVYHFAALTSPAESFQLADLYRKVTGEGAIELMHKVRAFSLQSRFFQPSAAAMLDTTAQYPQTEETPLIPTSPYAEAKIMAHRTAEALRKEGMFISCGIMFNHESPRRPLHFLPQKVAHGAAQIKLGVATQKLALGNLDARRDWGHAADYVRAAHAALQQSEPDVFVISTGEQYSVRDLCEAAFEYVGVEITWQGRGLDEKGINTKTGETIIEVSPQYFRPSEAGSLCGDSTKAKEKLGWAPQVAFRDLVRELVEHNVERLLVDSIPAVPGLSVRVARG